MQWLHTVSSAHLWLYFIGINLFTFLAYGLDKYYSRRNFWRIPEGTLLLLGLIGGSPAGFIAQQLFRHKRRKASFQWRFWLLVAVQCVALVYLWAFT